MSQRQSCDRCRQQKVRCTRDEPLQRGQCFSTTARPTFTRCERCTKAGVDCVYSVKQKPNRRSTQSSFRVENSVETGLGEAYWYQQCLGENLSSTGTSLDPGFSDVVCQISGVEDTKPIGVGFDSWGAPFEPLSPLSLDTLTTRSTTSIDPTFMTITPSTSEDHEDSVDTNDDAEDDNDNDIIANDAASSQLAYLSHKAVQATRRLSRSSQTPPTVSSSEVTEALDHTNALTRIIVEITGSKSKSNNFDTSAPIGGLVFSALACHQHLVTLFQAICDNIRRCLQTKRLVTSQQSHTCPASSDLGPSSMAQFVMVLQLLMHLINRLDRSVCPSHSSIWDEDKELFQPTTLEQYGLAMVESIEPTRTASHGCSASQEGLLTLVHDMTKTISDQHAKLRQMIQKLQLETEQAELHQQAA